MPLKYSPADYDDKFCLKINDTLWFFLLFLLRPYVVTIVSLVNRKDRMGLINLLYEDKMALWWGLLAGVPAALVIYAWVRRKPDASPLTRTLWHRGRELLALAAIANAAVVFIPFWMGIVRQLNMAGWIQLGISLGIVPILYSSTYIRDCFADYPKEETAES